MLFNILESSRLGGERRRGSSGILSNPRNNFHEKYEKKSLREEEER
jgi:hypothetical protein